MTIVLTMLDISLFREKPEVIRKDLEKRGLSTSLVDKIARLDKEWRISLKKAEEDRHEKNVASREIAELKKNGKNASKQIEKMQALDKRMRDLEQKVRQLKKERDSLLMTVPNLLDASVPKGKDLDDNVELSKWGKTEKKKAVNHGELIEKMGLASFERAAKTTGSGFVFLKGNLALLDLALQKYAIDFLTSKSYTLIEPPYMMNYHAYQGVTDLADFKDVMYKIEGEDMYLIATSEHPIAAMYMNEMVPEDALPLRFCGVSTNFRREVGRHGIDTRGLFRMHQFNKVEQFIFCKPEDSTSLHEELAKNMEELHKSLGIPYRIVNVCTGDIGTVAAKKYDLEGWSPRQGKYIELASCSNCTDYQARRLNIRYGKYGGDKALVHTLNSTGIATSRVMLAIIENFQTKDTIKIPKVLWPYMNGKKELGAE